jgi:peptidylprolyl isomerase
MGTGSGDAGYKFKDEFSDLRFDNSGVLAMANNGPSTNNSQFFYYTCSNAMVRWKTHYFGHVVGKGMDVVNRSK